jgi:hypothetical protein
MARPKKAPLTPLQKIAKKIGSDGEAIIAELEALDTEGLNQRVAQSSQSIHDTVAELNQNSEYVAAKEDVKLLSSGLKEVKKRQNAIISVCLQLRKDRGAVGSEGAA